MLRVVGLPRSDWALIVAAASLLTLAYPPFTLIAPALVCLVPAALLILQGTQDLSPWRRHLRQGFWYGTLTHGALLYWLAMALWAYRPSAVGLYLVAAVALGGATAAMFVAVGQIAGRSRGLLILAMPSGVVALEWLAGQLGPLGFPWHQLALTVSAVPVLVQAADLGGSAELGFIFATVNVSIALAWWMRRRPSVALAHAEVAAMILFFVLAYGLYRLGNVRLEPGATVAVIQPNVGVDEKWQLLRRDEVVERAIRLSQSATGVSGIVDALGRVVTRTEPFVATYAAGPTSRSRVLPLAAHVGGATGPLALGLLLLLMLVAPRDRRPNEVLVMATFLGRDPRDPGGAQTSVRRHFQKR